MCQCVQRRVRRGVVRLSRGSQQRRNRRKQHKEVQLHTRLQRATVQVPRPIHLGTKDALEALGRLILHRCVVQHARRMDHTSHRRQRCPHRFQHRPHRLQLRHVALHHLHTHTRRAQPVNHRLHRGIPGATARQEDKIPRSLLDQLPCKDQPQPSQSTRDDVGRVESEAPRARNGQHHLTHVLSQLHEAERIPVLALQVEDTHWHGADMPLLSLLTQSVQTAPVPLRVLCYHVVQRNGLIGDTRMLCRHLLPAPDPTLADLHEATVLTQHRK